MEGVQEKNLSWVLVDGNSDIRDQSGISQQASWCQTVIPRITVWHHEACWLIFYSIQWLCQRMTKALIKLEYAGWSGPLKW